MRIKWKYIVLIVSIFVNSFPMRGPLPTSESNSSQSSSETESDQNLENEVLLCELQAPDMYDQNELINTYRDLEPRKYQLETMTTKSEFSSEESSEDEDAYSETFKDSTTKYRRSKSKAKRAHSRKGKESKWISDESDNELEAVQKMTRLTEKDKEEIGAYVQTQAAPIAPQPNIVPQAQSSTLLYRALEVVETVAIGVVFAGGAVLMAYLTNKK